MQLESLSYIQRVRRFLGLKEFWILGHSMGAGIGALYAATFPEEVKVSYLHSLPIIGMERSF